MTVVSDTIFTLLMLAAGGFAATTIGLAVALVRARERAVRAEERAMTSQGGVDAHLRFDRLEHAVDSIAAEVERMAEGQRFVSRLLAERPVQERVDAVARAARVITPH